jgi:hypothetical protein
VTPAAALAELRALADPVRTAGAAAYHKAERDYLGIPVPVLTGRAQAWRATLDLPGRVVLADALWRSDIHEARIAAAKLLTQARIRGDAPVWQLIASWVPEFDAWAIADHASDAGARRLVADPSRLDEVEGWTRSPNMWTRRAALVITLPWTRHRHPRPRAGLGDRPGRRPRLVHPEGHRLVAARPVEARSRPHPRLPRRPRGPAETLRAQGGGEIPRAPVTSL